MRNYTRRKTEMNKITLEHINNILDNTKFEVDEKHGKLTIVTALLPNGFTVTESSGCVDPVNYDKNIGIEICKRKITDKIWYLEGYCLQQKLYEKGEK